MTSQIAPVRALLVEDLPLVAADLKKKCETLGYEVVGVVDTGQRAIDSVRRELSGGTLDLVLLDIRLKGDMNGIEAAAQIRQLAPEIPLVFLTDVQDDQVFEASLQVHPDSFLYKPVSLLRLSRALSLSVFNRRKKGKVSVTGSDSGPFDAETEAVSTTPETKSESTASPTLGPDLGDGLAYRNFFFLKVSTAMVRVPVDQIKYIVAHGSYCRIVTTEREFFLTKSMGAVMRELRRLPIANEVFEPISRSCHLNVNFIARVEGAEVFIQDEPTGAEPLRIGRTYLQPFKSRFLQL